MATLKVDLAVDLSVPFGSIGGLMQSETYKRSSVLQHWPEFRLRRFVAVFDTIYEKKISAGRSKEEAEAAAFAMAYASAERFQPTPEGSKAEAAVHYAATQASLQFAEGGMVIDQSFDWLLANLDLVNAAVENNAFNFKHQATEPLGVIRKLMRVEDVPAEIRASLDKDTPYVTVFSYFEGTPQPLRNIKTVSAEWIPAKRPDGRLEVILCDSFAVTDNPATDQSLGVGIVAQSNQERENMPETLQAAVQTVATENDLPDSDFAYIEPGGEKDETGKTVPRSLRHLPVNDEAHVRNAMGRLATTHIPPDAKREAAKKILARAEHFNIPVSDEWKHQYDLPAAGEKASLDDAGKNALPFIPPQGVEKSGNLMADPQTIDTKAFEALRSEVANLSAALETERTGKKEAALQAEALKVELQNTKGKLAEYKASLDSLNAAMLEKEANEVVLNLVREGRVISDDIGYFAGLYKTMGKAAFSELAAKLVAVHSGATSGRAIVASVDTNPVDVGGGALDGAVADAKLYLRGG